MLKTAKPKLRAAILKNVESNVIQAINEIAYNTLNGNNKLNNKTKKHLKKYKNEIRCLSCPKRSISSKRKVLIQKGGFLPTLIASVLSGIIGKIIENV